MTLLSLVGLRPKLLYIAMFILFLLLLSVFLIIIMHNFYDIFVTVIQHSVLLTALQLLHFSFSYV